MTTPRPRYQPRKSIRLAVVTLLTLVAALAASASTAAPSAPAFAVTTTCTDTSLLGSASRPQLVHRTIARSARTASYGWPVKPFDRQHAVRGFLDDPRVKDPGAAKRRGAFHFGIDIAVPDGTPVYAVEAGRIWYTSGHAIAVVAFDWSHEFGYWHVVPAVRDRQRVAKHQLIAYVGKNWGHVHFAERRHGIYLNPLRNGGIGPYVDRTAPTVDEVGWDGSTLVVAAHDTPDPQVAGLWRNEPVTPALLRWRVASTSGAAGGWKTAADFRHELLSRQGFWQLYSKRTRQNHESEPGQYCFKVARTLDPRETARIEVEVSDTAGNVAVYSATVSAAGAAL